MRSFGDQMMDILPLGFGIYLKTSHVYLLYNDSQFCIILQFFWAAPIAKFAPPLGGALGGGLLWLRLTPWLLRVSHFACVPFICVSNDGGPRAVTDECFRKRVGVALGSKFFSLKEASCFVASQLVRVLFPSWPPILRSLPTLYSASGQHHSRLDFIY